MEALLQHLREHQEASFAMDEMQRDGRAEAVQRTQPLRTYISVFRIDGEPILPPLMTSEKRHQMRELKERAMKIEERFEERKQKVNNNVKNLTVEVSSESSASSLYNPQGNISQRSQDYYDAKQKESEESMIILKDIIRRHSDGEESMASGVCNFHVRNSPRSDNDKLKKLQKSETLIFDNTTKEVIKQMKDADDQSTGFNEKKLQLRELGRKANLNYVQPKKPSHLLLAGINDKGGVSIPSICLNPPTPLFGARKICDPLVGKECNESFVLGESQTQMHYLQEDLSSDESFNSMLTRSDVRSTQTPPGAKGIPRSGKIHNLKAYSSPSNVSSKIQQFEAISSDHSSYNTSPNSSPDKTVQRGNKLDLCSTALSRSATSPSINLSASMPRPQTTPECSNNSSDNTLIRSSSFTLEAPSKALIDHMLQQKSSKNSPLNVEVMKNMPPVAREAPLPSRVHRDTIESKAKRVQKVELKPSRQRVQQKTTQHKLVNAASMSASYTPSAYPTHSSINNLYKTKKSPYDTPNSNRYAGHSVKNTTFLARKSPTSSSVPMVSNQKTNKSKSATTPVKQTTPIASPKPIVGEKDALTQMDKIQNEKFLRLLKQQEEEQKKLKEAFQMQQKLLIEQLSKEMDLEQTQRFETSNAVLTRHSSDLTHNQQNMDEENMTKSYPAIPNNSTFTNETNSTDNSCDQSFVPSLLLSNLSSIDHSNANTSIESTSVTVSNRSSQKMDSLHNAVVTTPKENGYVCNNDSVGSKHLSSSRRRLFPQDHMSPKSPPRTHVGVCSPSSSGYGFSETYQHQQHQSLTNVKKVPVPVGNNTSSRRLFPVHIDEHVASAAATTINAYVRGYLIRRLFKTEQIQRIVQTIHDTLVFVLNLHMETCDNPAEANAAANIKLKARLLQQLSSATRTLHLVFFQTSIKERMDIVARDRKRIQTKLLTMNRQRTPRIAG